MKITAGDLALKLGGKVIGNAELVLTGVSAYTNGYVGNVTFAENEKIFASAEESPSSAIIVPESFTSSRKTLISVKNPRVAFAQTIVLFHPPKKYAPQVHPTAVVDPSAVLGSDVHIGPKVVIASGAKIGARTAILAGSSIGENAMLGEDCVIHPNVSIYDRCEIGNRVSIHSGTVVGSDGFGFAFHNGRHIKIPQVGIVCIGDDVEIGSNVSIDRAALGATWIKQGTKIDNLVQIAHNVEVGEHCIIVAQVAIAGSTKLGNYVTVAGQAGIAGHLKIGDFSIVAGQSGVKDDLPPKSKVWGTPSQPILETQKQLIALQKLPGLLKRVKKLEKEFNAREEAASLE